MSGRGRGGDIERGWRAVEEGVDGGGWGSAKRAWVEEDKDGVDGLKWRRTWRALVLTD